MSHCQRIRACTIQLDNCDFFNIPFAQFGAYSFGKSTSSSNQWKTKFLISECDRIHRYAVVQVQHGHKIESLGAILNSKQFCVQRFFTSNSRESPRPQKSRKRRIIIDSGSDVYNLKWNVHRLTQLKNTVLCRKKKLPCLAFRIFYKFSSAQLCVFHAWLRLWLTYDLFFARHLVTSKSILTVINFRAALNVNFPFLS